MPRPIKTKTSNETKKAGMVVHIKFLIWANKSVPAIADARLVESDRGEVLSPKIAPDKIAPATKAGLIFIVIPIPKRAIPIVEMVVKALPIETPTKAQTKKTDGTKNLMLINLKPTTIKAGIIPALIQTAIKTPIKIKIKIGINAVLIPTLIPL